MTDASPNRVSAGPLRRLYHYALPHRGRVWAAVMASILNKLFDLAPPALIGMAVDIVVEREQSLLSRWGIEDLTTQLWILAGITFAIWLLESAFEYLQKWLWRNLAQTMQHEMRVQAYGHLQRLPLAFFESRRQGDLMAILNDDVNQLERFLDIGADDLIQVTTSSLVVGAAFFYLAPEVAWLAMLPMPFVLWGSMVFQRKVGPRYRVVRDRAAMLNSQLASNITGVATIKSFTAEEHEVARIEGLSDAYRSANRRAIALSSAFSPLIRMVIVAGFIATLVLGGVQTLEGTLAVGSYSVLVFLTQRLLWPLTRLGATFDLYQRAMASTRRVMDLLDAPSPHAAGGESLPGEVAGALDFDRVSFKYPERDALFDDLSFQVAPGQTVAFVGATGAGKSTVVKLLLRLVEPSGGEIRLDGTPIQTLSLTALRERIGLVSQDVFLFHGTVAENIAYGRRDATTQEIEAAARSGEAHEFIAALPQGYDTIVGEFGQRLSGGQRQRLSIARAVLKDPPILVLDEATSAVDNETEAAIQRSMAQIAKGRVTLVIAHRLSTIRHADHIIVLAVDEDRGGAATIAEQGKHDALVAAGGLYASLWSVQTGI